MTLAEQLAETEAIMAELARLMVPKPPAYIAERLKNITILRERNPDRFGLGAFQCRDEDWIKREVACPNHDANEKIDLLLREMESLINDM